MAEDLDISGASDFEDSEDEVPEEEYLEKAEELLMKETLRLREINGISGFDHLQEVLGRKFFNEDYFNGKGLDRGKLENEVRQDFENAMISKIENLKDKKAQKKFDKQKKIIETSKNLETKDTEKETLDFENLNKSLNELERKSQVLGRMNGMEKSYCLQKLKTTSVLLKHLKKTEQELQEKYEEYITKSRAQNNN